MRPRTMFAVGGMMVMALAVGFAQSAELPANQWVKLDKAAPGSRADGALIYDTADKRIMLLGGYIRGDAYSKPHPFDDLALDLASGQWENWIPKGKEWGPQFGDAKAPGWPNESLSFIDREGNTRPNLTSQRGQSYFNSYTWDPASRRAYTLCAWGNTFAYDPLVRVWTNLTTKLAPPNRLWGSLCADSVNKTVLLFGGNAKTPRGDPGTWVFETASNVWRELTFTSAALDGPGTSAADLHQGLKHFAEEVRARYYLCDLPDSRKVKLDEVAAKLLAEVANLTSGLNDAKGKADKQEQLQIGWALAEVDRTRMELESAKSLLAGMPTTNAIKSADAARESMAAARDALALQPPPRAMSKMVYDAARKEIVLFGGDQLDRLLSDTWVFDCASMRWQERRPAVNPPPRASHALVYLPKSGKILLFGGYGYGSSSDYCAGRCIPRPFDMWVYDAAANTWEALAPVEKGAAVPVMGSPSSTAAAADENDVVVAVSGGTWAFRADMLKGDAAATAKAGVKAGTVEPRRLAFVPEFYDEAPASDPVVAEAALKAVPVNTWVQIVPPKKPTQNRDWGSAVYSPDHDVILRWSGGHVAHCGTDVVRYHPGLNRWSLAYNAEVPLGFAYANDGTPQEWTFKHRPWMPTHTYKSYGYDPVMKRMLYSGSTPVTFVFDPELGDWEQQTIPAPFGGVCYTRTFCSTPKGAVVWAPCDNPSPSALWRMNAATRAWELLPLKGVLPAMSPDWQSAVYDSKRNRLLLLTRGKVVSYDLATGEAASLLSAGRELSTIAMREAVYLPDADVVLVGSHAAVAGFHLPVYDCAKNAWLGLELTGPDPIRRGSTGGATFNESMGLVYDPDRKLIMTLGQHDDVTVLKYDSTTAKLADLSKSNP